jgi:hypothetical protein
MTTLKAKAEHFYKHIFMKFESQIKGLKQLHKDDFNPEKLVEALFKATDDYIKGTRAFLNDEFGINEEEERKLFQKEIENFHNRV